MRARYLAVIFIAAVIVPSILLAVLSIRAAGREEAFVEKQLATTLLAEVTHTAGLASAQETGIADELRGVMELPAGTDYRRLLPALKKKNALVGVPFLLSQGQRILWPAGGSGLDEADRRFLEENSSFLGNISATPIYRNIAVVHQQEILAEAGKLDKESQQLPAEQPPADEKRRMAEKPPAEGSRDIRGVAAAEAAPEPEPMGPAKAGAAASPSAAAAEPASTPAPAPALARQRALDTFSQRADIQAKVYEQAQEKGEQINTRVAQPMVNAAPEAPAAGGTGQAAALPDSSETPAAEAQAAPAPPAAQPPAAAPRSQFVATPSLFSQIASQQEYGIIPRFINDKLSFLFWARQKDGRIAGCEIARSAFDDRIAGVLPATWSPARIITILDETGQPLASPPGSGGRDWRRPFVSQEIGESLPRWEAAAYLTNPSSISAQARSASLVIWILVLILFVSVAGGGAMVLTSVYSEVRTAQKKASFVANVSHELKTPLTSISLFIDLLRRPRKPDPNKSAQYLQLMAAETERLGRLINNVLDFSSLDKGTKKYAKEIVDLGQIAREVVESQRARLESRGFRVLFKAAGADGLVDADAEAMKQVLLNLLSNAEKYSTENKEIGVEIACEGEIVAAHVLDRGIGVPEKDRERIFKEFFRVDDSLSARVPGTGLGLTIARRIAREHGGDVTCHSREGGGSDFTLFLPAVQGDGKERRT